MKKRTKSGEPSGAGDTLPAPKDQMAEKRAQIARNQPSVGELAHLAAALVGGRKGDLRKLFGRRSNFGRHAKGRGAERTRRGEERRL